MAKKIGIVICNFNKQDYIVNCIRSVFASSIPESEYDVYVVDNASTDDSVKCIRESFGNKVNLIINKENLGGSGGFNTGLRAALKGDYPYIMLMDNDIIVDKDAILHLLEFLETHPETGMVGSKVYFMDEPEKIWGYGGHIDFEEYKQKDHYKNSIDGDSIPEISYCDYVAACSLMARADVIREIGLWPEENFIYWDDMEWGYRFREHGYQVAVYGKSKIWHKAGGRNATNTFIHYYMWRNRIRFFLKVLPREKREQFADTILTEMFRMIYSLKLKGETNVIKTLMYAFDDAVHGVTGKAAEGRILPRPEVASRLKTALGSCENVLISFNGDYEGLGNVVRGIRKCGEKIKIAISAAEYTEEIQTLKEQYPDCKITAEYEPEKYEKHLVICDHIFKLTADKKQDCYIDGWCNVIFTPEDFVYARSFEQTKELFLMCKKDFLL